MLFKPGVFFSPLQCWKHNNFMLSGNKKDKFRNKFGNLVSTDGTVVFVNYKHHNDKTFSFLFAVNSGLI